MAESTSGTQGHISDESLKEKFEAFNKKYNAKEMEKGQMSYRSFKHMTKKIKCLKKLTEFDFMPIFDKYSTKGTACKYIEYEHFNYCLRELAKKEAERTSGQKQPSQEAVTDTEQRVFQEIMELNVDKVRGYSTKRLSADHTSRKNASHITSNTAKQVVSGAAEFLGAVLPSVPHIGPVVNVLKEICGRIAAYKTITKEVTKFTVYLLSLSDTLAFIHENELYQSDQMKRKLEKLEDIFKVVKGILCKIENRQRKSFLKKITAKEEMERLQKVGDDIDHWLQMCASGKLDQIMQEVRAMGKNVVEMTPVVQRVDENVAEMKPVVQRVDENVVNKIKEILSGQVKSPTSEEDVDTKLPRRPNGFVDRPEIIKNIREALYKIKEKAGSVIIHGMGGSGKTTLAAESVRDARVLSECFPDGVFWVSIGQIEEQELLVKMQTLCKLYNDMECSVPANTKEANVRLRKIFAEQHPKSLLILDDVWTQPVAKALDIHSRILVTTRDQTVMDTVAGQITLVEIEQGFSEEQTMQVFSTLTAIPVESLPEEAKKIYEEVHGSPMAIGMISALLKDHRGRWQYYLEQLKEGKVSRFQKTMDYQHRSIADAISSSISNLDDDLRELYQDFAVFVGGVKVPTAVLEVLWSKHEASVEDTMDKFVKKSLAQREWNDVDKTYMYSLHDLQLGYLKETNKEKLPELHQKLIEGYKDKCNGDFSNLPDDKYIHWFIGYHFSHSGLNDLMAKTYLDLRFIKSILEVTGPPHLITDFENYSTNIIGVNHELERDHQVFLDFLRSSAYTLAEKDGEIIQLALCQPPDTKVYKQAKIAIEKGEKCVKDSEWCNRGTSIPLSCRTQTKLHEEEVNCAAFSPGSNKIVSCSDDNTVKISDSASGQELLSIDAPVDDGIVQVQYFPDGKHIITIGCDAEKLKLFFIPENMFTTTEGDKANRVLSKKEIHERFLVHVRELEMIDNTYLLTCKISHNGKYLAVGCWDGSIYIWEMESKEHGLLHKFQSRKCEAADCGFTDDEFLLATSTEHAGDGDQYLDICRISDGYHQVRHATKNIDEVESCSLKPGTWKVAYCTKYEIFYCDFENGTCSTLPTSYCGLFESIAHSPDGNFLAASHRDSVAVHVWDTRNEKLVGEIQNPSLVSSLSFSPESKRLVLGGQDGTITIWDVETIEREGLNGEATKAMPLNNKQRRIWAKLVRSFDGKGTEEFITGMKTRIKRIKILTDAELEKCQQPSDIIKKLKEQGKIAVCRSDIDLTQLIDILADMKATELQTKIKKYEEDMKNAGNINIARTQEAMESELEELPSYKIKSDPRGICIIINNVEFKRMPDGTQLSYRHGSDKDKEDLYHIFSKLKFVVEVYTNKKSNEIMEVAKRAAYQTTHTNYDCFAFCILSHGARGVVHGTDGRSVEISSITRHFQGINCETLRGKPKLFFIQACQGNIKQMGVSADDCEETPELLPNESDFLIGYSTLPGYVSWRDKQSGSWFIATLVKMLDKYSDRDDLLSIMIKVNDEVAKCSAQVEGGIYKQTPVPQPTLRKKVFLRK